MHAVEAIEQARVLGVECNDLLARYTRDHTEAKARIATIKEQLIAKYTQLRDAFDDATHKVYCSTLLASIDKYFGVDTPLLATPAVNQNLLLCEDTDNSAIHTRIKRADKGFHALDKGIKEVENQLAIDAVDTTFDLAHGLYMFRAVQNACNKPTLSRPANTIKTLEKALVCFQKAAKIDKIVQPQTPEPLSKLYITDITEFLPELKARVARERAASDAAEVVTDIAEDQNDEDEELQHVMEEGVGELQIGEVAAAGAAADFPI